MSDKITAKRTPKSFVLNEEELDLVEKAKKNTYQSFSHCARLGIRILADDSYKIVIKIGDGNYIKGVNTLINLLSHESIKDKVSELMRDMGIIE